MYILIIETTLFFYSPNHYLKKSRFSKSLKQDTMLNLEQKQYHILIRGEKVLEKSINHNSRVKKIYISNISRWIKQ